VSRKIIAAILASALLVACEAHQSVVPQGPPQGLAPSTRALAAAQPYLFAIPEKTNEIKWGRESSTALLKVITKGISEPAAVAAAANGIVFVANKGNSSITGYASPLYSGKAPGSLLFTTTTFLPTGPAAPPLALSVDERSNVFALLPYNIINEYVPPGYRLARWFRVPATVSSFVEASGGLYTSASAAVWIFSYPRSSTKGINVNPYSNIDPIALGLDQKRNLYAADGYLNQIFIYGHWRLGKPPIKTVKYGACCKHEIGRRLGDQSLLVSSSLYLYLIQRNEKVVQYAPPDYTGITLIARGGSPKSAAIDAQGNLIVVNGSGGIGLYQVPAGKLLKTISPTTNFKAVATVP
jgi:hypothetical protein